MHRLSIGTKVKVVDDVERANSFLIGQCGVVIGYKWNRVREENNLPVVRLESGKVVSGWGLWYEVQT